MLRVLQEQVDAQIRRYPIEIIDAADAASARRARAGLPLGLGLCGFGILSTLSGLVIRITTRAVPPVIEPAG